MSVTLSLSGSLCFCQLLCQGRNVCGCVCGGWITPSGLSTGWTELGLGLRGSFMPQHTLPRSTHPSWSYSQPVWWWEETFQYIPRFQPLLERKRWGEGRRKVDESEKCLTACVRAYAGTCMCTKKWKVQSLGSRQWVQRNNKSQWIQVGENKEGKKLKWFPAYSLLYIFSQPFQRGICWGLHLFHLIRVPGLS